ncbi:MAG: hypothetical protein Q4G68_05945 [Planctomycetia bacterium]|nr:hypothetical protein [Planctomycetia bacterium]
MKHSMILAFVMLLAFGGTVFAQVSKTELAADDFLPVIAGGSTEVANPDEVAVAVVAQCDEKHTTVTAESAQDAINVAVQENKGGTREIGCTCIKFGSGLGYVATGQGTYRNMPNPTASRLSKRQAYVTAFIMAKKTLAEYLGGLSVNNVNTLKESFDSINTSEGSTHNLSTEATETNEQIVDAILRGFVVYSVEDVLQEQTVYVTIVTTPKTLGKLTRLSTAYIEADSIREGLTQVIAEVKNGIVPPVGGKAIQVVATGEMAFVGFGSHVIETNTSKAIQARMKLSASKIAEARAKAALCGLIVGNQTYWKGLINVEQADTFKGFEVTEDPVNENRVNNIDKLENARQDFFNKTKNSDLYLDVQKGILPPGVTQKTWTDSENAWVYSMAVYIPSVTQQAADFKTQMDDAILVQPLQPQPVADPITDSDDSENHSQKMDSEIIREGNGTEQGPSGQVTDPNDL